MSKDNPDAHDAVAELKKGLGHLFKAAKSAVNELPTKDFEDAVLTGVKEVGRALGNVKDTLETELLGKSEGASQGETSARAPSAPAPAATAPSNAAPAAAAAQGASPADAPATEQVRISAEPPKPAEPDADTGAGI